MLIDDYGFQCKEIRVLPAGGDSNILCSFRGYHREITWRLEQNREYKFIKFKIPAWEDLEIYDKED